MRISIPLALTLSASLFAAGCTVAERSPTSISIRHDAANDAFVQQKADRYCREQGFEKGIKVQMTPAEQTYILSTVVSRFDCV